MDSLPASSPTPRRSWRLPSWLRWLLLALVAAALLFRFVNAPVPVSGHVLQTGTLVAEVMGTGTLEPRVKSTLSPRIQERLAEVLVDQGDPIQPGQLLARLDDGELRQQVAVAEAALAAARATVERVRADENRAEAVLHQARLDHQRLADLVRDNISAQAEFDKAHEGLRVAEADLRRSIAAITEAEQQVRTAEQTLLYQRERLAFTQLHSPYHGLVVRRDRDAGTVVVPGAAILQLAATNEIWISAWVDETVIPSLRTGQVARVVFRSAPEQNYPAEVARLGRETDRETREFLVDVRLQQLPPHWTLGQRAEVFIESGRNDNVVLLPQAFVRWQEGQAGVWLNDGGRARWQPVKLGLRGTLNAEVLEGLAAGQQVIRPTTPRARPLAPGRRVTVRSAP